MILKEMNPVLSMLENLGDPPVFKCGIITRILSCKSCFNLVLDLFILGLWQVFCMWDGMWRFLNLGSTRWQVSWLLSAVISHVPVLVAKAHAGASIGGSCHNLPGESLLVAWTLYPNPKDVVSFCFVLFSFVSVSVHFLLHVSETIYGVLPVCGIIYLLF